MIVMYIRYCEAYMNHLLLFLECTGLPFRKLNKQLLFENHKVRRLGVDVDKVNRARHEVRLKLGLTCAINFVTFITPMICSSASVIHLRNVMKI